MMSVSHAYKHACKGVKNIHTIHFNHSASTYIFEEILILYNQRYMLPSILLDHPIAGIGLCVKAVQQLKVVLIPTSVTQCSRCRETGDLYRGRLECECMSSIVQLLRVAVTFTITSFGFGILLYIDTCLCTSSKLVTEIKLLT